jgi:hypothetical protein
MQASLGERDGDCVAPTILGAGAGIGAGPAGPEMIILTVRDIRCSAAPVPGPYSRLIPPRPSGHPD